MSSNILTSIPIFAPTQISGCSLWLDASDTTTLSLSGSVITAWRDKSGSGNNTTPINSPTYVSGATPYVATRNATQSFTLPAGVNATTNGQAGCFYFVYADTKSTGGNYTALFSASGSFSQYLFRPDSQSYGLNGVLSSSLTSTLNSTNTIIYGISYTNNSSTFTLRTNGNNITFASPPTITPSGTFSLSDTSWAGDKANLNMYEVISVVGSVSLSQMQQIEGYLAWKWNLQGNLPSDHPYKNAVFSRIPLPSQYRTLSASIPLAPSLSPFVFGFSPRSIPGCTLWLDGADPNGNGSIPANGATVSTWSDKSGNGYSGTGGTSPTYTVGRGVTFNGTSQYLTLPAGSIPSGNSAYSWFFVLSVSATTTAAGIILRADNGSGNNNNAFTSTDNKFSYYSASVGGALNGTTTLVFNTSYILNYIYTQNTTIVANLNGTQENSQVATSLNNSSSFCYIGGQPSIANFWFPGTISEIIVYNNAVTTAQRQQVEGYLAWKWGLPGSLPASQPYKNSPPGLSIPVVPTNRQMSNRVFSPLNFSGCTLWLDGQDINGNGSTLSTGATISTWVDKSSSGINLTGTNVTYSYDSVYRVNAPTFNGTSSIFNQANTSLYPLNNVSTFSIISVARRLSTNSYQAVYFAPGSTNLLIYRFNNTNLSEWYLGPAADVYLNNTSTNGDGINELITQVSGTATGYINGNRIGSNTTRTSSGQLNFVLGRQDGNPFLNGYIYEVIVYNTAVSTAQRQNIEGYLAWKWGLQGSLPSSHPYKLFPPPP